MHEFYFALLVVAMITSGLAALQVAVRRVNLLAAAVFFISFYFMVQELQKIRHGG